MGLGARFVLSDSSTPRMDLVISRITRRTEHKVVKLNRLVG